MICKKCTIENLDYRNKNVSKCNKKMFNKKFTMKKQFINCKKGTMMIFPRYESNTLQNWHNNLKGLRT